MLKIGNLCFESEKMEINVSNFTANAIHNAKHTNELKADGFIHLRVDYKDAGMGSNSCGPALLEEYRVNDKDIDFEFTISPIKE